MENKILMLDKIEDLYDDGGEVVGKQCFDSTGDSVKVKIGQGGGLKKRWVELQIGRAYSFTMGEFKPPGKDLSFPFVQDFKSVESEFVKQAQKQVETKTIDSKNRGFALSFSKDISCAQIAVGQKVTAIETINRAKLFNAYLDREDVDEAIQTYAEIQKQFKKEE